MYKLNLPPISQPTSRTTCISSLMGYKKHHESVGIPTFLSRITTRGCQTKSKRRWCRFSVNYTLKPERKAGQSFDSCLPIKLGYYMTGRWPSRGWTRYWAKSLYIYPTAAADVWCTSLKDSYSRYAASSAFNVEVFLICSYKNLVGISVRCSDRLSFDGVMSTRWWDTLSKLSERALSMISGILSLRKAASFCLSAFRKILD